MAQHRPYLVKRRVTKNGNLSGIIAVIDNEDQRIKTDQLLSLMVIDGYDFYVDLHNADRPAKLQVVHELNANGGTYYFRTIGDSTRANNFNAVPAIQDVTARTKFKMFQNRKAYATLKDPHKVKAKR